MGKQGISEKALHREGAFKYSLFIQLLPGFDRVLWFCLLLVKEKLLGF